MILLVEEPQGRKHPSMGIAV